jgi:hypothetical protein
MEGDMRPLVSGLVLGLLLLGARDGHAQVCNPVCANQPPACCGVVAQADTFMAYESATHNSTIFRGIVPNTAGATCDVTTDVNGITPTVIDGPLSPVSDLLSSTVKLNFNLGEGIERWQSVGGLFGGGTCFTPEVTGFRHPGVVVSVTDGCGTHQVSIGKPAFFCVTPTLKFICFESKNLNAVPLPPGFDRAEDVCAVIQ